MLVNVLLAAAVLTHPVEAPRLGDPALLDGVRDLTVVVVGDSWGDSLGLGMQQVAGRDPARKITAVEQAIGGCGIMQPEKIITPDGQAIPAKPQCDDWPERWLRLVELYRPSAVLLEHVWDAHHPQRLPGHDRAMTMLDPVYRARFEAQLDRAIGVLGSTGAKVYVTTQPVVLPESRPVVEAMNRAQAAAAARRPGTGLLDLYGQLCTAICPKTVSGVPVYDETGHLTRPARERIATWILNTIHSDLKQP